MYVYNYAKEKKPQKRRKNDEFRIKRYYLTMSGI